MSLKPLQTAKYVGVKWTPNHDMAVAFMAPFVERQRFEHLRKEGRAVLNSIGSDYYNLENVGKAARFDTIVEEQWPQRQHVRAGIDGVEWAYSEKAHMYRIKYHLESPYGEQLRQLVGHPSGMATTDEQTQHLQESVYFDTPAASLPVEAGDAREYIERQVVEMRRLLAIQAAKGMWWLTNPKAYVTTYQPGEADMLARLQEQRRRAREAAMKPDLRHR